MKEKDVIVRTKTTTSRSSSKSLEYKELGNKCYSSKNYVNAIKYYKLGINETTSNDDEHDKAALHSNLALAYIKLESWDDAEMECNKALLRLINNAQSSRSKDNKGLMAKLYYRRCTVREKIGNVQDGIDDANQCITILEDMNNYGSERKVALAAKKRLQKRHDNNNSPSVNKSLRASACVSAQQQRDVITRLLAQSAIIRVPGEAYYLISMDWWKRWCLHVNFSQADSSSLFRGDVTTILEEKKDDVNSSDSDDSSSNDDDDDDNDDNDDNDDDQQPCYPGEIDNSSIQLDSNYAFHRQYLIPTFKDIKPHLVRNYHYQIIPCQVFKALVHWYSTSTDPILRRTSSDASICLYPMTSSSSSSKSDTKTKNNNKHRCTTCQSPCSKRCTSCNISYYCNISCQSSDWMYHKSSCAKIQSNKRRRGICGLHNLGNTCFMNSALQCLASVTPLTTYFLSTQYTSNLNSNNPLASPNNRLAKSYSALLRDLFLVPLTLNSNHIPVCNPSKFKNSVSCFAPRFSGFQQHDSQEFLSYILDGLHEDLNRILGPRRYVEHSTVEYRPNSLDSLNVKPNLHHAGAKSWDDYETRNDSLIFDTFYGQFKSTCHCPHCHKVSISFDIFNHLSLEIPVKLQHQLPITSLSILVHPPSISSPPIHCNITLPNASQVQDIQQQLALLYPKTTITDDADKQWVICDVRDHTIHDILMSTKPIHTLNNNNEKNDNNEDILTTAYYIDSYDLTTSIHVIVSHQFCGNDDNLVKVGCPFIISFSSSWTCHHLCYHIWNTIKHYYYTSISSSNNNEYDDNDNVPTDIIRIHLVDEHGSYKSIHNHKKKNDDNNNDDMLVNDMFNIQLDNTTTSDATTSSSQLPFHSKTNVTNVLGNDCIEQFIFFSIHWTQPSKDLTHALQNHDSLSTNMNDNLSTNQQQYQQQHSQNNTTTLHECLQHFTKPEKLDETNQWFCSDCNEHVCALKTMELWRLPNILIMHIKRFEYSNASSSYHQSTNYHNQQHSSNIFSSYLNQPQRKKINSLIDFPLCNLDMNSYLASSSSNNNNENNDDFILSTITPAQYDLFGVINHYGKMGFGHYTAYCRKWNELDNVFDDWYLYDDSIVRRLDNQNEEDLITNAAYVLFYKRRIFT